MAKQNVKILVTGAAGFIGSFVSIALLKKGYEVVGIDNLNDYYDTQLKKDRLKLIPELGFSFIESDIANQALLDDIFKKKQFNIVINLAAQAGVRYSIENPKSYSESNLVGFLNILECCRHHKISNLIYASSSSVYGLNSKMPFSVSDNVDHPVSLYAATKKANELMAHTYSHLYGLPTTGLRFFTVYGPWGRPDMAYFTFTKNIIEGNTIKVFNNGDMQRDFTYIDDIVEAIVRLVSKPSIPAKEWNSSKPDPSRSSAPYRIHNIGNNSPVRLGDFIKTIENILGYEAKKEYLPMQMGDVQATYANISSLVSEVGYSPSTSIDEGLAKFVEWYKSYHQIN